MGLTGSEDDNIASNDHTLAIAKSQRKCLRREESKPYKPIGKNCPMPPRIIKPPTARLTSRTARTESSRLVLDA